MTALNRAVASARVGTEVIRVRGLTFRYPKAAESRRCVAWSSPSAAAKSSGF